MSFKLILFIAMIYCIILLYNVTYNTPVLLGGSYDEYDDLETIRDKSDKKINCAVVDGNNLLFKLKEQYKITQYNEALKKAIDLCCKHFKYVIFVLKDVNNLSDYNTLLYHSNLTLVIGSGDFKARDDFAVIRIAEIIANQYNNTILLTRDRFRDVNNISSHHSPVEYKVYGKNSSKIYKQLNDIGDKFVFIGNWSFKKMLTGYTFNTSHLKGLWNRLPNRGSVAGELIYVF